MKSHPGLQEDNVFPLANALPIELGAPTPSEIIVFFQVDDLCRAAFDWLTLVAPVLRIHGFSSVMLCFLLPSSEQCDLFTVLPTLCAGNPWAEDFLFCFPLVQMYALQRAQSCGSCLPLRKDANPFPRQECWLLTVQFLILGIMRLILPVGEIFLSGNSLPTSVYYNQSHTRI